MFVAELKAARNTLVLWGLSGAPQLQGVTKRWGNVVKQPSQPLRANRRLGEKKENAGKNMCSLRSEVKDLNSWSVA